jgi:hypothetical protein
MIVCLRGTGHQLRHRQISADDRCVFCGQVEYVEHLFLRCPFATVVWDSVKEGFQLRLARKDLRHMKQWIFDFLGRATPVQASALAVTCWHIWESRNDARNGKGVLIRVRVAAKVRAYVDNIVQFCVKPSSAKRCESSSNQAWIPPPAGWVCVNVDAAVFTAEHRMG